MRLFFEQMRGDLNSGLAKAGKSTSANNGVGIGNAGDDTFHASCDQGVGARTGSSRMATWLKVDVERRASSSFTRLFESENFGVLHAVVGMEALAYDLAVA